MHQNQIKMASEDFPDEEYLSEQEDKDESDSHPLGNPAPPPDIDLELLRGDRIGDTVYSGKWCIEIVMKLMESNVIVKESASTSLEDAAGDNAGSDSKMTKQPEVVDMDEDLQNQVGVLWDMTGNEEVCVYLNSVGAVESICFVIANSRCPRATEMCAGMLANIITHEVMWNILHNDKTIYSVLIPLLANEDQPTLVEVTRFFNTALCHTNHSHCFASLYDAAGLLLQELARILSGSTNGDLLKHSAELVYNLLDLDDNDTKFCSVFAEPDFLLACAEASKELGYDQLSSGQNHIMDIFYRFTTYQAGIDALESCMDQIAVACSTYLSRLCHDLSLSNSCVTITTTLATLNHLLCRQKRVQAAIFSSPRLTGYILKVLVTVYTRLGLYSSISSSSTSKHSGANARPRQSKWTEPEDTPTKTGSRETGSWSERAIAASSGQSSINTTPEASPLTRHGSKDLDISWSERRVGTPLASQSPGDQQWKMPRGTKRVSKKKDASASQRERESNDSKVEEVSMEDSSEAGQSITSNEELNMSCRDEKDSKDSIEITESMSEETTITGAKKIGYEERFTDENSRRSEGFEPLERSVEDGGEEDEGTKEIGVKAEVQGVSKDEALNVSDLAINESTSVGNTAFDDSSDEDGNENDKLPKDNGDGFEDEARPVAEDKYHKLLDTICDFCTDLFQMAKEMSSRETEAYHVSDLMVYLDRHCEKPELRALAKCVSPTQATVEGILTLCNLFNTGRVAKVLQCFVQKREEPVVDTPGQTKS